MSAHAAHLLLADVQEMLEVEAWELLLPPTRDRLAMGDDAVEVEFRVEAGQLVAEVVGPVLQAELRLPLALHDPAEPLVCMLLALVAASRQEA